MKIARFTHVSEARYAEDMHGREDAMALADIPLPRRATPGSAGYDFVTPAEVTVPAGGTAPRRRGSCQWTGPVSR